MSTTELVWLKSSYSGTGGDNCVEAAMCPEAVLVRDSKDLRRQPLSISPAAWVDFIGHATR
ncbi:DUF397 domain-containing protein [Streptomyces zingiberis]|uniref:DUF397 domain-containing protein n=1 Tax=Streptomyces zingiberis TaxID=2053010 RepID=A0ABX1BWE2_9ACTN|nr:DUF397 domain-containing protein [Streptomyces zingiberis]NJQ02027.1 DUF397 domain-containing protein [Streptomyces zingiberis]